MASVQISAANLASVSSTFGLQWCHEENLILIGVLTELTMLAKRTNTVVRPKLICKQVISKLESHEKKFIRTPAQVMERVKRLKRNYNEAISTYSTCKYFELLHSLWGGKNPVGYMIPEISITEYQDYNEESSPLAIIKKEGQRENCDEPGTSMEESPPFIRISSVMGGGLKEPEIRPNNCKQESTMSVSSSSSDSVEAISTSKVLNATGQKRKRLRIESSIERATKHLASVIRESNENFMKLERQFRQEERQYERILKEQEREQKERQQRMEAVEKERQLQIERMQEEMRRQEERALQRSHEEKMLKSQQDHEMRLFKLIGELLSPGQSKTNPPETLPEGSEENS